MQNRMMMINLNDIISWHIFSNYSQRLITTTMYSSNGDTVATTKKKKKYKFVKFFVKNIIRVRVEYTLNNVIDIQNNRAFSR